MRPLNAWMDGKKHFLPNTGIQRPKETLQRRPELSFSSLQRMGVAKSMVFNTCGILYLWSSGNRTPVDNEVLYHVYICILYSWVCL